MSRRGGWREREESCREGQWWKASPLKEGREIRSLRAEQSREER